MDYKINNFQISKNFNLREFCSKDTMEVKISAILVEKLQTIRDHYNLPVIINSGYRTPIQNKKVGGMPNSKHLMGIAADIYIPNIELKQLVGTCIQVGFSKIIAYPEKGFIHVDLGVDRRVIIPKSWFDDIDEFTSVDPALLYPYEEFKKRYLEKR